MENIITCRVIDLLEPNQNAINLAKLFRMPSAALPALRSELNIVPSEQAPATVAPLTASPSDSPLAVRTRAPLSVAATHSVVAVEAAPPPQSATMAVKDTAGTLTNLGRNAAFEDLGDLEVHIPVGVRSVNAETFKRMLGYKSTATLLKKVGERWQPFDGVIDLTDDSQVFRVGTIAVYS